MIKAMENEPILLLRVVASIMLDPYKELLWPTQDGPPCPSEHTEGNMVCSGNLDQAHMPISFRKGPQAGLG